MVVKISEVKSISYPETGEEGKQIVFTEVRKTPQVQVMDDRPETQLVHNVMQQLQSMGFPLPGQAGNKKRPKMVVYMTEEEFEEIQLPLEVNKRYDLKFWKGKIHLEEV